MRPSKPWIDIEAADQGPLTVAGAYISHGVEHILLGFDHLLFVLALVLIVRGIGGFSCGPLPPSPWPIRSHCLSRRSDTWRFPDRRSRPPLRSASCCSPYEIVRIGRGETSLTARWPWVVAFSFGLLHGFGFAGALTAIGLPQNDVPLALFAFNVGVEVGQLLFIAAVLGLLALVKRLPLPRPLAQHALPVASYAIGTLAAFWFVERLSGFWT